MRESAVSLLAQRKFKKVTKNGIICKTEPGMVASIELRNKNEPISARVLAEFLREKLRANRQRKCRCLMGKGGTQAGIVDNVLEKCDNTNSYRVLRIDSSDGDFLSSVIVRIDNRTAEQRVSPLCLTP